MPQTQLHSDIAESRFNPWYVPDDSRRPGGHLLSKAGREHRDRGICWNSPGWNQHLQEDRD